jgi:hypothetical protein
VPEARDDGKSWATSGQEHARQRLISAIGSTIEMTCAELNAAARTKDGWLGTEDWLKRLPYALDVILRHIIETSSVSSYDIKMLRTHAGLISAMSGKTFTVMDTAQLEACATECATEFGLTSAAML